MVLLLYKGLPFQPQWQELVPFRHFDSCTSGLTLRALEASYLPHRSQLNTTFLPLFLLYFLSPPVSTFTTPYPLPRACCRYAFSTASCNSYLASGRGSPMMVWVLGYAICWSDGCGAYREFCQPWLAAQRDAIGRIKVVYRS